MANEIIYNPLLKKGFQELGDTAAQEAEIEDLRQHKVTKFFAATDTLQAGEIAQYQGDDDSVNGLINGFFYKLTASTIIPVNSIFYRIFNDITIGGVTVTAGDYYKIADLPNSEINNQRVENRPTNGNYWLYNTANNYNFINKTVYDFQNKAFLKVVSQSGYIVTFDNGTTANFSSGGTLPVSIIETSTIDGVTLNMSPAVYAVPNNLYIVVEYDGQQTPLVLAQGSEWDLLQTTEPIYINPTFVQVNAQPVETVSDTVTEDDPNAVSGGAVFNAIKDAIPSEDKWEVVETLINNSSTVVSRPFSVPKSGFYLLMIGGTNGGNNCIARLLTPSVSPFGNTLPIASVVMLDGYGVANLCYLFSGHTYNFQLTEVIEPTTARIIKLS